MASNLVNPEQKIRFDPSLGVISPEWYGSSPRRQSRVGRRVALLFAVVALDLAVWGGAVVGIILFLHWAG
jgi:hypothetical protein